MAFRATGIVFDLDGTLVDSAPGILRCVGDALSGVTPTGDSRVGDLRVGPPVREMIAGVLADAGEETIDRAVTAFRRCYDAGGWREATPYPGVDAMLQTLQSAGVRLFVVTNKPVVPTLLIVGNLGWDTVFEAVVCRDSVTPPFPDKSAAVRHLLETRSLEPARTIFVGDAAEDARAAAHNDLRFIFASYGYGEASTRSGAAATIGAPREVLGQLGSTPA